MTDYIGQPMPRFEDRRFLTGQGSYSDDLSEPDQVFAIFVRSPHAHANVESVDLDDARSAPGVLAAYAAQDLQAAGVEAIPSFTRTPPFQVLNADGSEMPLASQYPLATDRVRYVGEPLAMVVAETANQARDAAERVVVDYRECGAVVDIDRARAEDAPQLWPDAPGNQSSHWEIGNSQAVDQALAGAAHIVNLAVEYPRVIIAFMEPRACLASHDPDSGGFLLRAGCQSAHRLRDVLAITLGVDGDFVRVVVPDVGGGFGARSNVYPEFVCTLHAARDLGRPVAWTSDRSEAFLADTQARSQRMHATLGLDANGIITGLRVTSDWWHGAYISPRSIYVLANWMGPLIGGNYKVPASHFSCRGLFTNTAPIAAYRGVSRTEAIYVMERLMDAAARQSGIDRIDLRRRNMIALADMPLTTPTGLAFGKADFHGNFDRALDAIDLAGFAERRAKAESQGKVRGIGITPFVLGAGGVPDEFAEIHLHGTGEVSVLVGTQDFGMGHETVFSQVVADRFGVTPDKVTLIQGDTDLIAAGAGGQGSRCMRIGGGAIMLASDSVLAKALNLAADLLEAAPADIGFEVPDFVVRGTDRRIGLSKVAAHAEAQGSPLQADETFVTTAPSFPNGCHACEVEIDPETGQLAVESFVCVVDPGKIVNPLIVHGQVHGAVAQAIGEAVVEKVVYDRQSGQLSSGSLMDYALPRADDVPYFTTVFNPLPGEDNPLGVKGVGEAGTVGSQATIVNAALDALSPLGVETIDMPLTPETIWRALNEE